MKKLYAVVFMTGTLIMVALYLDFKAESPISLPRKRCIEICSEVLIKKSVFPDYSEAIKKCETLFSDDCQLTVRKP